MAGFGKPASWKKITISEGKMEETVEFWSQLRAYDSRRVPSPSPSFPEKQIISSDWCQFSKHF